MGGGCRRNDLDGRSSVGGTWGDEAEWPLARSTRTRYSLRANAVLSSDKPANDPPATYVFDPRNPVPTLGGNVSSQGTLMFQGAADQRCRPDFWLCSDSKPLSARNDILVHQTPPLTRDTAITVRV